MIKKKIIIYITIVLFLGFFVSAAFLKSFNSETYLTFTFQDAVSKGWIWNAEITLQNRTLNTFYQSDSGLQKYTFTNLEPGNWTIKVSAPYYKSAIIPVLIKKGRNNLPQPIELTGLEIPNLSYFVPFEQIEGRDINIEFRPVGKDGQAVLNHPCMDLWISARITIQMKNDLTAQESSTSGSYRGQEIYSGALEWVWDPLPETLFRYSAVISGDTILESNAPLHIIDYLIVIPKQNSISREEIGEIVEQIWREKTPDKLKMILDKDNDRFTYFVYTSWNVEGIQ
ncbi:MAG: hypothetical protein DRP58_10345 [Spirochaetes bacterium]|nr:MAG: hypothetical protein DRP58_10345 [Spirochaetota bacterium]